MNYAAPEFVHLWVLPLNPTYPAETLKNYPDAANPARSLGNTDPLTSSFVLLPLLLIVAPHADSSLAAPEATFSPSWLLPIVITYTMFLLLIP